MGKRSKLLVFVALFGIVFLLFTGSASAAVDFPADEAGICAWVKAKSSVPNLNAAVPAFATIERQTDDYIIGTVAMSWHTEEEYPHVYVSTDGWVVAYYPNDRSSGWLLPWYYYSGGPISTTTLKEAAQIVCDQIGGTTTGLKYYDFRHPEATKMMIIVESTTGSEWFKVTIPTNYTTSRVDWSHYGSTTCYISSTDGYSRAYLDGVHFDTCNCGTRYHYGSFDSSTEFQNGIEHKVDLSVYKGTGRVGLVLEYAE
jgi:hypothetical protein